MKKFYHLPFTLLLVCFATLYTYSQNPGEIDPSFTIGDSMIKNGVVLCTATQTDGKIVVGGDFTELGGVEANRIVRINVDGTKDDSFNIGTGFNNQVNCLSIQTDGKLLVGGSFTSYNGTVSKYLIRLNTDGSIDNTFITGSGFTQRVNTLAIQNDGKIIVGGNFISYNSVSTKYITRLNNDGSIDSSFNIGTGFGNIVTSVAIQVDGKIIVGGSFTAFNTTSNNRIIRLNTNGSVDTTFNISAGFDSKVNTIKIQPDGKIIAGGDFAYYRNILSKRLVRINANGTRDNSFDVGSGFEGNVISIYIQNDGKTIVGGDFYLYKGLYTGKIIRLNNDASADINFDSGTGYNSVVNCIEPYLNNQIITGGEFNFYKTTNIPCVSRLSESGILDSSFDCESFKTNITGLSYSLAKHNDGKIISVGDFTSSFGTPSSRIVRFNQDGTVDSTFNTGTGFNLNPETVTIQSDNKILVGGGFNSYNGNEAKSLVRLNYDGSIDNTFDLDSTFSGYVYSIKIQTDGKILVGGTFKNYLNRDSLVRLNPDGSLDTTFNAGNTGFTSLVGDTSGVRTMTIQPDGKILITGLLYYYNGIVLNKSIVRINSDGVYDSTFIAFNGFNIGTTESIYKMEVLSNNQILICGSLPSTPSMSGLFLLNENGSLDTSFNSSASVIGFTVQNDGKIIAVGNFPSYNNLNYNRIIRLNPDSSIDSTFNPGTGFNTLVRSVLIDNDSIIVGGVFTSYNNTYASGIIKLDASSSLQSSDYEIEKLILSPNPVKNILNLNLSIKNSSEVNSIRIIDLTGKTLLNVNTFQKDINVENLESGVYIIKVLIDNEEFSSKFIKE